MKFTLKVNGFDDGGWVPRSHTCEGEDCSPRIDWSGEPAGTHSFALIVEDPDAPMGTWTHWLLWDIPAHQHSIAERFTPGLTGASGRNDFGRAGYGGPCPPKGHGPHRYYFRLCAVDRPAIGLPPGARRQELEHALEGRVLGEAKYMGRYERK